MANDGDMPEGPECYIPRLEMAMKEIPDKYASVLWTVTGEGMSPQVALACIEFVDRIIDDEREPKLRKEICEEHNVSDVSVSNQYERILEELDTDKEVNPASEARKQGTYNS